MIQPYKKRGRYELPCHASDLIYLILRADLGLHLKSNKFPPFVKKYNPVYFPLKKVSLKGS